ncbi:MAG: tRNA epoxyqueuosine(34) reductase QueG [Candidatus Eremiobacteraeota bacterium]|nr:tRNA epoxyqueuosine(34) reductase QueG [Candidatus Eremiobacteraeota bacterium]
MIGSFERGDLETWRYGSAYAASASDPSRVLRDAKAVVCVAVAYGAEPPPNRPPLTGRVSNYAWPQDYHATLRGLLLELASTIDAYAGAPATKIACDTAPLAERARAAQAGVGWIGKHTNLISPAAGSYVFLGEIVTTVPLAADPPVKKSCGSCARCVAACPTGALRGDYTIDARRCISDLVQRTGPIPRAMRPLVGDWVWGCDLCQIVCPPTQQAAGSRLSPFGAPAHESAYPDLIALLHLKSAEYRRRYRRSAIGWRGAAVLRRNAAIVLGNLLDRAAVPDLSRALGSDPHPMVRGAAAWALGRIASPPALEALRAAARTESDADVLSEISSASRGNVEPPPERSPLEPM